MLKPTDVLYLDKYQAYKAFIEECTYKVYRAEEVLHKHHILPKHLKTEVPDRFNTVFLNVEDHIKAHLLLADCFTEKSYERISNIRSAKLLSKNSIKEKHLLEELYANQRGENNPFYGKKHTEATKQKLRESTRKARQGVSYDEFYKTAAQLERNKRAEKVKEVWSRRTEEERENIRSKISKTKKKNGSSLSGSKNPNSKKINVDGIGYGSIAEALKALNISRYKLINKHKMFYYA